MDGEHYANSRAGSAFQRLNPFKTPVLKASTWTATIRDFFWFIVFVALLIAFTVVETRRLKGLPPISDTVTKRTYPPTKYSVATMTGVTKGMTMKWDYTGSECEQAIKDYNAANGVDIPVKYDKAGPVDDRVVVPLCRSTRPVEKDVVSFVASDPQNFNPSKCFVQFFQISTTEPAAGTERVYEPVPYNYTIGNETFTGYQDSFKTVNTGYAVSSDSWVKFVCPYTFYPSAGDPNSPGIHNHKRAFMTFDSTIDDIKGIETVLPVLQFSDFNAADVGPAGDTFSLTVQNTYNLTTVKDGFSILQLLSSIGGAAGALLSVLRIINGITSAPCEKQVGQRMGGKSVSGTELAVAPGSAAGGAGGSGGGSSAGTVVAGAAAVGAVAVAGGVATDVLNP